MAFPFGLAFRSNLCKYKQRIFTSIHNAFSIDFLINPIQHYCASNYLLPKARS